jgi:hypothetical protein
MDTARLKTSCRIGSGCFVATVIGWHRNELVEVPRCDSIHLDDVITALNAIHGDPPSGRNQLHKDLLDRWGPNTESGPVLSNQIRSEQPVKSGNVYRGGMDHDGSIA